MVDEVKLPERAQYLYVIGPSRDGPLKIGVAERPERRLIELQVGNPKQLSLYWVYPCPHGLVHEQLMHRLLARHRLSGEWFDLPVEKVIGALWIIVSSEVTMAEYEEEFLRGWAMHIGLNLSGSGVVKTLVTSDLKAYWEDRDGSS